MIINLHTSEFIPMNPRTDREHEITHILSCLQGSLPLKYLGVSIHFEKLKRKDLQPVVDKLIKRMTGWSGRLLAYSSRLELIRSCLASILVYLLSFIKFPKWAIKLVESQMANCLWNDDASSHRYHLAT
jgi:hypothetical protein